MIERNKEVCSLYQKSNAALKSFLELCLLGSGRSVQQADGYPIEKLQ
jgi:hypothetical protein